MTGVVRGAVIGAKGLVLRYDERLLIVNLGEEIRLDVVDEPLLAPPFGKIWGLRWSSNDTEAIETEGAWRVPATTAIVLAPQQT
jgi:maltooligosyltrehalose trehalohydrolase